MSDIHKILESIEKIEKSKLEECENEEEILDEASEPEQEDDGNYKIKLAIPFEQVVDLIFREDDKRAGRIALRKVLRGEEKRLTLRERGIMAEALFDLLPIIAGDRTVYSRIKRLKNG